MIAEYLQDIRQQCDAGTEQDEPDDIERLRILLAVIGQMQVDQNQAGNSNWQIHKKYEAPMEVCDDKAPRDRPEHGSDRARNGDKAHSADELGFGKGSHQGEPADRDHHGAGRDKGSRRDRDCRSVWP